MRHLVFAQLNGRAREHHLALTRLAPATETFLHDHDFVELFLVTGGAGQHVCNGHASALGRGMLVGVRAVDAHYFRSAADAPLQFINLALAPAWWAQVLKIVAPAVGEAWARA
ncbi:MAG TPA: AraC family ligand binding domain-containing protein, partial [Opitutus sp.]|nr:AraC family ligand binding domain-containing protein [Opitutus sp.]